MKKLLFTIVAVLMFVACSPRYGGGIGVSTPTYQHGNASSELHRDTNGTVYGSIGVAYQWTKED